MNEDWFVRIWRLGFLIFIVYVLAGVFNAFALDETLTPGERIVALTLLGEARGEGEKGIYAVACVIQKRAKQRKLSPAKVCLQPKQFSIWNGIKGEEELHYLWKSKHAKYARKLARAVCRGGKLSLTYVGDADHYYSKKYLKKPPYWAKNKKPVKIIGNHVFYKLK